MRTPLILFLLLASFAPPPSFAQGGSTGGTIGNRNKSISGAATGDRAGTHSATKSATRCKLAATWNNRAPAGNSTWTIAANGTANEDGMGSAQGHATLSGHKLVINWHSGITSGRYIIELNRNCSGGTGQVVIGGNSWAATFTAAP
jgi:hypothetical protein